MHVWAHDGGARACVQAKLDAALHTARTQAASAKAAAAKGTGTGEAEDVTGGGAHGVVDETIGAWAHLMHARDSPDDTWQKVHAASMRAVQPASPHTCMHACWPPPSLPTLLGRYKQAGCVLHQSRWTSAKRRHGGAGPFRACV